MAVLAAVGHFSSSFFLLLLLSFYSSCRAMYSCHFFLSGSQDYYDVSSLQDPAADYVIPAYVQGENVTVTLNVCSPVLNQTAGKDVVAFITWPNGSHTVMATTDLTQNELTISSWNLHGYYGFAVAFPLVQNNKIVLEFGFMCDESSVTRTTPFQTTNGLDSLLLIFWRTVHACQETSPNSSSHALTTAQIVYIVLSCAGVSLIGLGIVIVYMRRKYRRRLRIAHVEAKVAAQRSQHYENFGGENQPLLPAERGSASDPGNYLENIEVGEKLSEGSFGEVYRGSWLGITVALKRLKNAEAMKDFEDEHKTVRRLRHPHVVQFLGLYTAHGADKYIVMEFMSLGAVDKLILAQKEDITHVDLIVMAKQAAAGMAYLESAHIVHRDLALRNLLATPRAEEERFLIKVSDFGMSRFTGKSDTYATKGGKTLPIRWAAPEVLAAEQPTFTHKSDVWSFGVVLWELFSYVQKPYPDCESNLEAARRVVAGHGMAAPEGCPGSVYSLMLLCWRQLPAQRPSFSSLLASIEQVAERIHVEYEERQQEEAHRARYRHLKSGEFPPPRGGVELKESVSEYANNPQSLGIVS